MEETQKNDLKVRTKDFALRVIRLYNSLPKSGVGQILGKQLLRSATSFGAHYRESIRSRSKAEFISKLEVGLQELEESIYWMELIVESDIFSHERLKDLMQEADELMAITTTTIKKVKSKRPK